MAEAGHVHGYETVRSLSVQRADSLLTFSDDNSALLNRHFRMGVADTRHKM